MEAHDRAKRRSALQEELLHLYLRLNGYFVTGFIVHSPMYGRNVAEIDALAVRFPYNLEPEREVQASPFLAPSDSLVDLLICEAKSRGRPLRFNESLRTSPGAAETVLRWSGLFQPEEVSELADRLREALTPTNPPAPTLPTVPGPRATRIRALLSSLERHGRAENQTAFLDGEELFGYLQRCLCPVNVREDCATTYDFTSWGTRFERIVRFVKERGPTARTTIKDLYRAVGL